MRVVITGAGGMLGHDLRRACERDEVIAPSSAEMDVADRDAVLQVLTTVRPDVVLHTVAWTDVDGCELDPDRAFSVNAFGTRNVAEGCRLSGAHLVHVSTDYVFGGDLDRPYHEWDEARPISAYGRSKLAGEHEAQVQTGGAATIVRTSALNGVHGRSVVRTVLDLARREPARPLRFVDDQRTCPTFTDDLAPLLRRLAAGRLPGVFHVTNQGGTTWFGFVRAILEEAGIDPGRVEPIATPDLDPPRAAPRPANSVLENAALRHAGLALLPDHHEPLARLVKELSS